MATQNESMKVKQGAWAVHIKGVARKMSQGKDPGTYLEIEIMRPKMQYPSKVQCWDVPQLQHLERHVGSTRTLILRPQRLRNGKSDDGIFDSYWWEAIGEAEPEDTSKESHPPQFSREEPLPFEEEPPYEEPLLSWPSPPPLAAISSDPTRVSIERQKALDLAERAYFNWWTKPDIETPPTFADVSGQILQVAEKFYGWIHSGPLPVTMNGSEIDVHGTNGKGGAR